MTILAAQKKNIEELTSCPNCGSENVKKCFEAGDIFYRVTDQLFVLSVCKKCTLYFLSRRVVPSAVGQYYPFEYGPYKNKASVPVQVHADSLLSKIIRVPISLITSLLRRVIMPGYMRKLDRLSMPEANAKVLLDFGCGSDIFLNRFKHSDMVTIGMDFTPGVISKVKSSGHIGVLYEGESSWDQLQDSSIDFIRMSHVTEHLYDPPHVFSKLCQKMKSGGLLHIIVPNPKGISARIFGKYFLAFADLPRHVMLYPLPLLAKLLEKKGFEVVESLQEVVTSDIVRSIHIKRNYNNASASTIHASLHDPWLNQLFFIPMWISAVFSRADRYHLLVKKRKNESSF